MAFSFSKCPRAAACLAVWSAATGFSGNLAPAARWTFEDGAVELKKGAALADAGAHGKSLRFAGGASRATVAAPAGLPAIPGSASAYTIMLRLKPDDGLVGDSLVGMSRMAGRRAAKFMSAMNDGKWHHVAVAFDPARKGTEYTLWLDWDDKSSPWCFSSVHDRSGRVSKCVLPFSLKNGKAVFGGQAGFGMFTIDYCGLVDDVAIFSRALDSGELAAYLAGAAPSAPSVP